MEPLGGLKILLLWIQAGLLAGSHGAASRLSGEDVLLLKEEPDPKCFARTQDDFTCFFENSDNKTYDLFYTLGRLMGQPKQKCEMSVQRTEERTFLHVCSFPESDVIFHVDINLEVVQRATSRVLHVRTVSVEDHFLLQPPFNVSLHPNGHVGQLKVSWRTKVSKYLEKDVMHRIQYSSRAAGRKIKESKDDQTLESLVPGDVVNVRVAIKSSSEGHWSGWSRPVQTAVPQSTDDIFMECYTADLNSVTCEWNGSRYGAETEFKIYYKTCLRDCWSWSGWSECSDRGNFTNLCTFTGDVHRKVKVKVTGASPGISRTFYSNEFMLNNSIKTVPPSRPTGSLKNNQLCLRWEAPLASLPYCLEYEVDCQIGGGVGLKMMNVAEAEACVDVPAGRRYSVRVRARPSGCSYSGHWSSWSHALTGDTPSDIGLWLMLFIPVSLLIIIITVIAMFPTYLRKLKQYFWPPVPNLDKVLQDFLLEINRQTSQDPPEITKQCFEETTSSVVEVMSEDELPASRKRSEEFTELLPAEASSCSSEEAGGSPRTDAFPNYVTLNEDCVVLCPQGNSYAYEELREKGEPAVGDEPLQKSADDSSLGLDFQNYSYVPHDEAADRPGGEATAQSGSGNLYTNSPCSPECV